MGSVEQPTSPDTARLPLADGIAGATQRLFEGVLQVSRELLKHLDAHDPQGDHITHLGIVTENLVRAGDYFYDAMTTVRALLCVNCRRLNAAQGKCFGQSLDRCLLLNGSRLQHAV